MARDRHEPSNLVLTALYDVSMGTPNRTTQVERINWSRTEGPLKISYSGRRAVAFLRDSLDLETRIGTCDLRVFPISMGKRTIGEDGQPYSYLVPCDFLASLTIEVFICWTMGRGGGWHEVKMTLDSEARTMSMLSGLSSGEFVTHIDLGVDADLKKLFHYFRIVGRLTADRQDPNLRRRERMSPGVTEQEIENHQWFCDDGVQLAEVALFDNPYGPFSNYHF